LILSISYSGINLLFFLIVFSGILSLIYNILVHKIIEKKYVVIVFSILVLLLALIAKKHIAAGLNDILILVVIGSFYVNNDIVRKVLTLLSLIVLNLYCIMTTEPNIFYIIIYFIVFLFYRFNLARFEQISEIKKQDIEFNKIHLKFFGIYTFICILILIPLLFWGKKYNKNIFTSRYSKETKKQTKINKEIKYRFPYSHLIWFGAVSAAGYFIMRKMFNKKIKQKLSDKIIEHELTAQGFYKKLTEKNEKKYFLPKNNNGKLISRYEVLINRLSKKTKIDIEKMSPLERYNELSKKLKWDNSKKQFFLNITNLFVKARYSNYKITDNELFLFEDLFYNI
jgi:hypothetical protein